jgi:hypothetical protein
MEETDEIIELIKDLFYNDIEKDKFINFIKNNNNEIKANNLIKQFNKLLDLKKPKI